MFDWSEEVFTIGKLGRDMKKKKAAKNKCVFCGQGPSIEKSIL